MNNMLKKITNVSMTKFVEEVVTKNEDGIESVHRYELSKNMKMLSLGALGSVKLYSVNIETCGIKTVTMNLNFSTRHCEPTGLASEVIRYWYELVKCYVLDYSKKLNESIKYTDEQLSTMSDRLDKASAIDIMTNEDLAEYVRYIAVKERINDALKICDMMVPANSIPVCETAKYIVWSATNNSIEAFDEDMKIACTKVYDEVKAIYENGFSNSTANVKKLRELMDAVCAKVWIESTNVKAYPFTCNDRLAREVLAKFYEGRKWGKNGDVTKKIGSKKSITKEIILACIEEMQKKNK